MCNPCFTMPTPIDPSDHRWYQRAVFYEAAVRGFFDSDGDGLGDFKGLTQKLAYLEWVGGEWPGAGACCLWWCVLCLSAAEGAGLGDFKGLTQKLDYLEWLGVDCLWLLPFYQSPLRDGGYDISDFFTILPEYGNLADAVELIQQ